MIGKLPMKMTGEQIAEAVSYYLNDKVFQGPVKVISVRAARATKGEGRGGNGAFNVTIESEELTKTSKTKDTGGP